jgi:hypothetical protein
MPGKKKLTVAEKYRKLKKQTEDAGMEVKERKGKLVVSRKKKKKK